MLNEKTYKFVIRGVNSYIEGIIVGMMHCLCREDPAEPFGYAIREISDEKAEDPTRQICAMLRVDTTEEKFLEFKDCVERKYENLKGFKFAVIPD